jgi:energy-coupling factor transport system permease protein
VWGIPCVIGVSYKISYAVALALRYIPDIQREYRDISLSQQARGTEMSKKSSLVNRLKVASSILIPLILSSMERIETISNAMELRGFGKGAKRTWYSGRRFSRTDIVSIVVCILLAVLSLGITLLNGSRYFNPFI